MRRMAPGALALLAGLAWGLAGAPATAETIGPEGATGVAPEQAGVIRSGGALNQFRSVSNWVTSTTRQQDYVDVPEMRLVVQAQRRSRLLITFSAECRARPDAAGSNAAVFVEARVNGVRIDSIAPSGNVVLCEEGPFFVASHSYRWTSPPVTTRRSIVSIQYRYASNDSNGTAQLGDKHLTVQFQQR